MVSMYTLPVLRCLPIILLVLPASASDSDGCSTKRDGANSDTARSNAGDTRRVEFRKQASFGTEEWRPPLRVKGRAPRNR
eukprot:scaffold2512_cov120-Cylindrotheca_fusiformis.AAC.8